MTFVPKHLVDRARTVLGDPMGAVDLGPGPAIMPAKGDTILTATEAAIEWHDNVEATCQHEEWTRYPAEPECGVFTDYEECSLCGKLREVRL